MKQELSPSSNTELDLTVLCVPWVNTCLVLVLLLGMFCAIPCDSTSIHRFSMFDCLILTIHFDSLFMSIGSVIRTEGPHNDAWLRARGPPMMLPRQSPLRPMRD